MYYVGIDWADQKHDITIVDHEGNIICRNLTIPNNHHGFEELIDILRELSAESGDFKIGIETPHNLLVDFLIGLQYPVYAIFPGNMKSFRKRYRPSGARDDQFDSFVLADVLRTDATQRHWRRVDFGSELAREIRILARDQHQVVKLQTTLTNSLQSALKAYYPEYIAFFTKTACKSSLAFITRYPDFESAQKLKFQQLNTFFKEQHYYNDKAVRKIHDLLQQPHLTAPQSLSAAKKLKALVCAETLTQIATVLQKYSTRLKTLIDKHPDGKIFLSYPGVAYSNSARLLALFGDNRDLYSNVSEVQALVGSAPVTEKSGKSLCITYFRTACNKFYRDTLHQVAFASIKEIPWAKTYYQKHRAAGKNHSHALRCLANVHLKILFAMWKNRTAYDENIFLAQRARHHMQSTSVNPELACRIVDSTGKSKT